MATPAIDHYYNKWNKLPNSDRLNQLNVAISLRMLDQLEMLIQLQEKMLASQERVEKLLTEKYAEPGAGQTLP